MELINGREISDDIRLQVKEKVQTAGISPNLAIIIVGDDKESLLYVGLKEKAVGFIGGTVQHLVLPGNTSQTAGRLVAANQIPVSMGFCLLNHAGSRRWCNATVLIRMWMVLIQ